MIDVDPILLSKQQLSFLFDANVGSFTLADFDFVRFEKWLRKPAALLFYGLVIDEYPGQSQELIEVEFKDGFFLLTKFQN